MTRRPRVVRDDDAVPGTRAAVDGEFLSFGREENGATPVFSPMTTAVSETQAVDDDKFLSLRRAGNGAAPVFLQ